MKHFSKILFYFSVIFFQIYFPIFAHASSKKISAQFDEKALLVELTGKDENKMNDVDLYAEIVMSYQSQDMKTMAERVSLFIKKHSKSPFADNALYLAGRLALEKKDYSTALKYFQRIQENYPKSNRVVSAQFAKAVAYKKMKLVPQSKKVFQEIIKLYPGSPESYRADSEMRMLN